LNAPAFRALKNIMDKARLLRFFARESHPSIATNAERIASKWLDHAALEVSKKAASLATCSLNKCFSNKTL
jgi:hypothetical protein